MTIKTFKPGDLNHAHQRLCPAAARRGLGRLRSHSSTQSMDRKRLSAHRQPGMPAWLAIRLGDGHRLGNGAPLFPQRQDHPTPPQNLAVLGLLPSRQTAPMATIRRSGVLQKPDFACAPRSAGKPGCPAWEGYAVRSNGAMRYSASSDAWSVVLIGLRVGTSVGSNWPRALFSSGLVLSRSSYEFYASAWLPPQV